MWRALAEQSFAPRVHTRMRAPQQRHRHFNDKEGACLAVKETVKIVAIMPDQHTQRVKR